MWEPSLLHSTFGTVRFNIRLLTPPRTQGMSSHRIKALALLAASIACLAFGATAAEQHAYPTVAYLKKELDRNQPGFALGYVTGVLQTLRHASSQSIKNGGKSLGCITYDVNLSPLELAQYLVRNLNDNPKFGPDTELHPHLIQIELVGMLMPRGACD